MYLYPWFGPPSLTVAKLKEYALSAQNAPISRLGWGGLGIESVGHPVVEKGLDSEVGDTAGKAKPDLFVTVTSADGLIVPPSDNLTATLAVPLVTICPDHEALVLLLVTTLRPVNVQPENVLPAGAPTVQVTLPPRVTTEGVHVRLATVIGTVGITISIRDRRKANSRTSDRHSLG